MRVEVAGETALAGEAIDSAVSDLGRIALVIGLVIAIVLACFLRALVAPLYLLGASVLALLSALGLTVWISRTPWATTASSTTCRSSRPCC
jgi:RND superfamily putative drug exporter